MSLPRRLSRLPLVLALGAVVLALGTGVAAAHVSVSSTDAAPGGFGKLTFRVPNESDAASTVGLRIQIPEETALASLSLQPVPGWTAITTVSSLPEPIEVHGQQISAYVSVVEFRAERGGGIGPGEFGEFALAGGPFPDADSVAFNVVQTYSDGSESAWIEPTVDGQPEPEFPAPVLTLTPGSGDGAPSADGTATETPAAHDQHETQPGALALFLSILALLVGGTGAFLGWRASRRTVSP